MLKYLGILLILWELLSDYVQPLVRSKIGKMGLSVMTIVLFYSRLRERSENRAQAVILRKVAERVGVEWDGPTKKSKIGVATSLRKLYFSLHRALSPEPRRKKPMQIDKKWLIGLISYIVYFAKQMFPELAVPDELVDRLAEFVLMLIMLIPMIVNMFKKGPRQHPFDGGGVNAQYPNSLDSTK